MKNILVSCVCLLVPPLITIVRGGNEHNFRPDYTFIEELGWLKVHEFPVNWHEARQRCHAEGATIASPVTEDLRDAMMAMLRNPQNEYIRTYIHTGIHQLFSKNYYTTIEGQHLDMFEHRWSNDGSGRDGDCVNMESSNGFIAREDCYSSLIYICYRNVTKLTQYNKQCETHDKNYIFNPQTNSCYKYHTKNSNWSNAYRTCYAELGHLVIVNSAIETNYLSELIQNNTNIENNTPDSFLDHIHQIAYIGMLVWQHDRGYLTIHGQSQSEAGYQKFFDAMENIYENDGPRNHGCGAIRYNGLIDIFNCDNEYHFICEKEI